MLGPLALITQLRRAGKTGIVAGDAVAAFFTGAGCVSADWTLTWPTGLIRSATLEAVDRSALPSIRTRSGMSR